VRVRVPGLTREGAILVPERAVLRGMGGQTVHVVGTGDSVAVRDVVARAWAAHQWLIERGLAPGDRVIVGATRVVAPGAVVTPVPLATPPVSRPLAASPRGGG
jgi:membrane fusion protein, multidrug efflux system